MHQTKQPLCILSFKSWKINTLSSKIIQTEKAKSSHFDRTRGYKNQKFPTQEFSKVFEITGMIYSNSERSEQFLK